MTIRAVFFDVDFTLIHPGPTFQGEGYQRFCAKHGMQVDAGAFTRAVAAASSLLEDAKGQRYDPQFFIDYTRRIIEEMGGSGPGLDACTREMYEEWAACQHFSLYDDVEPVFRELTGRGIRIGLISNTHRSLASFQSHFELDDLVSGAISSSDHGFMKPHPSIFQAALDLLGVGAEESVMVGDSPWDDIEGARRIGMRAVLLRRSGVRPRWSEARLEDVPVIRSLHELPVLVCYESGAGNRDS
jgi:putative hydrolase of the HAD superfamily